MSDSRQPSDDREPYEPPALSDLGTLADVTLGETGPVQDSEGEGSQ